MSLSNFGLFWTTLSIFWMIWPICEIFPDLISSIICFWLRNGTASGLLSDILVKLLWLCLWSIPAIVILVECRRFNVREFLSRASCSWYRVKSAPEPERELKLSKSSKNELELRCIKQRNQSKNNWTCLADGVKVDIINENFLDNAAFLLIYVFSSSKSE